MVYALCMLIIFLQRFSVYIHILRAGVSQSVAL